MRPALRAFPDGKIVVLCTPATAKQEKFRMLLSSCAGNIVVSPQPALAQKIERHLHALDFLQDEAEEIVAAEQPDALVLGCTHYVFIRHLFARIVGNERVFDGNAGVARRLQAVLSEQGLCTERGKTGGVLFDAV